MGNQKQNFVGCTGSSRCSDIVVLDPRFARSHHNLPKLDPGSPGSKKIFSVRDPRSVGSHGNGAVAISKISKMPRENENIRSKILQDLGSCILGIPDPGSFWDPGTCLEPGIFLWGAQPGRLIFLSDTAPLSKIICHLYREVIRNDDSRCALFGCTNPREAFQFFALRLGEDDKEITILVCTRRKKLSDKIVKTIGSHSLQCTYC